MYKRQWFQMRPMQAEAELARRILGLQVGHELGQWQLAAFPQAWVQAWPLWHLLMNWQLEWWWPLATQTLNM